MARTLVSVLEGLAALALACGPVGAQELIPPTDGVVRPLYSDLAVLEADETRKDLPCSVTPNKPNLGFDMKFHSGYEVSVPLKELSGDGNLLTMIFRVTPGSQPESPVYFMQKVTVPDIADNARGEAFLPGIFDVGEGKYHVSWLMRDRSERVCASNWDVEATLPARDRGMPLSIQANAVQPVDRDAFRPEPPANRDSRGLYVKVLVNFAPQDFAAAIMDAADTGALVSILRNVDREPRVGKVSVIAFNMQEQRIIFRQDGAGQIDFPGLGKALKSLNLGTVDMAHLIHKNSDTEFLSGLITGELGDPKGSSEMPDAVIIAGPKVNLDDGVPRETLQELDLSFPVFYMNYALDPLASPWRDTIGNAVRTLKGAEYSVSRPRDVYFAWNEILGRIVKSKVEKTSAQGSLAR
jgi:hypothetical protein